MRLDAHGLTVTAPDGWEARIERRTPTVEGEDARPVIHAATFPLPEERGDYGSGAVELMGPADVFVAVLEFESAAANSNLFDRIGMPRALGSNQFGTNNLQRWIPGQAGHQTFFTEGGRAFCLYVVLGSYADRERLTLVANKLLSGIQIESSIPKGIA
jgi:hypothetical protein